MLVTESTVDTSTILRNRSTLQDAATRDWERICRRFLSAVGEDQRPAVARLLELPHYSSPGLRNWLTAITYRGAQLPEQIPAAVIEVYLLDPEAMPLHDCERCGLAIPVRPSRLYGDDGDPEQVYFPACPACGGRTGWYLFWSQRAERSHQDFTTKLRKRKSR